MTGAHPGPPWSPGTGAEPEPPLSAEDREHALAQERDTRAKERERHEAATAPRDMTPALGVPGGPGPWRRAVEGASVAFHRRGWADARWSFLFGSDTRYAAAEPARDAEPEPPPEPEHVHGPMIKPPVWTWEVPLYFWFGGMAAGSSFVALACDVAGDHRSARVARMVALGALGPSPVLLIVDLGRPERFYNMLRVFKPRSPMNMGAWALTAFGNLAAGAVAADLLGRPRLARGLGAANAVVGGYLGSYTGVLLATTAVPVWARSRMFLGPIFIATGAATGAAACRLALVATGLREGHPTRRALGRVERGAIAAELVLSQVNEARLGRLAAATGEGVAGRYVTAAKWLVRTGLALGFARRRLGPRAHDAASACYLAAGLCFRFGWVKAGRASAGDDEAVARMARGRATSGEPEAAFRVVQR
jgi:formate-dependent nitrite reductase membrane component NrfD